MFYSGRFFLSFVFPLLIHVVSSSLIKILSGSIYVFLTGENLTKKKKKKDLEIIALCNKMRSTYIHYLIELIYYLFLYRVFYHLLLAWERVDCRFLKIIKN